MARFYLHLSTPDEYFQDNIGYDVDDPVAAHSAAVRLAFRVEKLVPFFLDRALDFRRWTVEITNEKQEGVVTVIFPTNTRSIA
jgi:hypothetical protein